MTLELMSRRWTTFCRGKVMVLLLLSFCLMLVTAILRLQFYPRIGLEGTGVTGSQIMQTEDQSVQLVPERAEAFSDKFHQKDSVRFTPMGNRSVAVSSTGKFPSPFAIKRRALFITTAVSGNLGNKMFQYASLLGIAHLNRMTPFYGSSSELQVMFMVNHIHDWPHKQFKVRNEKHFSTYDSAFEDLAQENTTIMQYFQSWKYFYPILEIVRKEFTFKPHIRATAEKIVNKLFPKMKTRTRVGIHVRRGDMLLQHHIDKGYHTAPAAYLHQAMGYMRQKHPDVVFIVVTDDSIWCRSNLKGSDYAMADPGSAEVHMAVLAACDHVIMTVGTYGWWGGLLAGGEVVYYWDPALLLHKPPLPVEIKHPEDFFPPDWVPLSGL